MYLPLSSSVCPTWISWKLTNGACGDGMRLKSGQITLLKMCAFRAAMVPGSAETRIGSEMCEATASTISGSAAT